MNSSFYEVFNNHKEKFILNVGYSKGTDWSVEIKSRKLQRDIIFEQHPDLSLLMAKAEVVLKEFLTEYEGGY